MGRAPGPNPGGHGPRLLRNAFVRTLPSLMRHEVTLVGASCLIAANFFRAESRRLSNSMVECRPLKPEAAGSTPASDAVPCPKFPQHWWGERPREPLSQIAADFAGSRGRSLHPKTAFAIFDGSQDWVIAS